MLSEKPHYLSTHFNTGIARQLLFTVTQLLST